jgi:cobalamin synthase
LQTILIPGAILLVAIGWLTVPSIWIAVQPAVGELLKALSSLLNPSDLQQATEQATQQVTQVRSGLLSTGLLALAVLVAYLFAVFLGLLVAVFVGYVEWWVLDRWCRRRLRLSSFNEYKRRWYAYIDSLEKAHNSYVTKQVIAFHFQARTGLALLVLALALAIGPWNVGSLPTWISLIVAAFLLVSAIYDHWMLAQFRNRRFALRPDATARPEDTLRALVNAWYQRCATRPLQSVLPLLSADGSQILDPATACTALQSLMQFPDDEVSPAEKGMLYPTLLR